MPGAYVFPGGAVDAADAHAACDEADAELLRRVGEVTGVGDRARAFAIATLRECFEEAGLWLGVDEPTVDLAALRARLHAGASIGALSSEAGLPLSTRVLHPWSHWVTPMGLPKRFDTLFFVCRAPRGQEPTVDAGETTTLEWISPPAALQSHAAGSFQMEFASRSAPCAR
jgi:8-oxo-dGTP pyrophosphatase MutT (NUDIX family)